MYREGRPNRLASLLNRGWAAAGKAGLSPGLLVALEVRGRRSGRPISFPLMVADYQGERYLVAMLTRAEGELGGQRASGRRAGGPAPRPA
jgi:hypothetical protein